MEAVRWLEVITWLAGLALVADYSSLRLAASVDSAHAVEVFEQHRESQPDALSPRRSLLQPGSVDQSLWSPSRIDAFRRTSLRETPEAVLRIPALNIQVPVYSGTRESQLDRGAGHIGGTASLDAARLDAIPGNVGIAAHRDGFFRGLKDARPGQIIYIDTPTQTLRYRVIRSRVVMPTDVSVLSPTTVPTITLVTCYPFYFVGPAPQRFIVQAEIDTSSVTRQAARESTHP